MFRLWLSWMLPSSSLGDVSGEDDGESVRGGRWWWRVSEEEDGEWESRGRGCHPDGIIRLGNMTDAQISSALVPGTTSSHLIFFFIWESRSQIHGSPILFLQFVFILLPWNIQYSNRADLHKSSDPTTTRNVKHWQSLAKFTVLYCQYMISTPGSC